MATDFSMNAYKPQFDFGFGLSYTRFEYTNFSLSKNMLTGNDSIEVIVTVKNTGNVKGKEVVQLYYTDLVASITPSVKKLMGYSKIELMPQELKEIRFMIHRQDLSFINKELKRVTEDGEFQIMINNQKKSLYVN